MAAVPELRLHAHAAAHPLGGFAHNGQPDPRAFVGTVGMHAFEHVENPPVVLRVNADAVVLDPKAHNGADDFRANGHTGPYAGRDELDRVGQEIGNTLHQTGTTAQIG